MKRLLIVGASVGLFANIASAQASATFNISYASLPATPAPSTFLLAAIGLLAAFFAYRRMQKLPAGRPLAAILLAIGLGFVQMNKLSATLSVTTESMTGPGPLVFSLVNSQVGNVVNNTGVSQQITGIILNPNPSGLVLVTPQLSPQCTVGMTLASGAGCYVEASAL